MNLASRWSYFCTYLHAIHCWSENFLLWMGRGGGVGGGRDQNMLQMLTGGPKYMKIRRAIFGKVHGRIVKEIWIISQFPAKHKGVTSGPKIVLARPGLARLLGYGHGVINNEFIIYIAYSPQSDCISLFRDPTITVWPSRIRFYVRDVILVVRSVTKQSREKHWHLSLYVQNIAGYREKKKKKELLKILKIKCHFKFHFVTDRKLLWIRPNDKTRQDNALFRVLYSPMYIDFIQII